MPGGTDLWKEIGLAVVGAWVMFWTRSLFSNAGMDSLDYEGSLSEMGAMLSQGRLRWRDKAMFYAKRDVRSVAASFTTAAVAMDGRFLVGGHDLYNAACAGLGGAGVVWAMTSEEEDLQDGFDRSASVVAVRIAMEGEEPPVFGVGMRCVARGRGGKRSVRQSRPSRRARPDFAAETLANEDWGSGRSFSRLPPGQKAWLYGKALFCNVCSVVFWKGVEEIIEGSGPDTDWTGLFYFLVGILVLAGTKRLSLNSGLDDDLTLTGVEQTSPTNEGLSSYNYKHPFSVAAPTRDASRRVCRVVCGGFRMPPSCASFSALRRSTRDCPGWVTTAAELTGVVFAWTGIEWYIWDDCYIADTWIRDFVYVGVGLTILIGTGTFFNLAGTISPMAVLKQVHQHNRHEEMRPLLSSDEILIQPDTP
eukprot:jgi/Undpi1/4373/HiC_scaffold_17.g07732.m1